jgi:hypothetical protein
MVLGKKARMTTTTNPEEGMYIHNLEPGSVLDVETKHRTYHLEYLGGEEVRISGHPSYCPQPVRALLQGSTTDAGDFEAGFVGRGMHLVFRRADDQRDVVTSAIKSVHVEMAGQSS